VGQGAPCGKGDRGETDGAVTDIYYNGVKATRKPWSRRCAPARRRRLEPVGIGDYRDIMVLAAG
jgi:hypothetical protein